MKNNEKGRSMVEMLGVLAIIMVLSAGGLAGYSKAMKQHKMNTFMNQMVRMQQQLSEKFNNVKIDGTLTNRDLIPLGIFDGFDVDATRTECEIWQSSGAGTVINAMGGCILVEISDSCGGENGYCLEIDLGKGEQGEQLCLWFLKNYSWDMLTGMDSSSGFNADWLQNDSENYIPDMCYSCAYDYDGCWLDTNWRF